MSEHKGLFYSDGNLWAQTGKIVTTFTLAGAFAFPAVDLAIDLVKENKNTMQKISNASLSDAYQTARDGAEEWALRGMLFAGALAAFSARERRKKNKSDQTPQP